MSSQCCGQQITRPWGLQALLQNWSKRWGCLTLPLALHPHLLLLLQLLLLLLLLMLQRCSKLLLHGTGSPMALASSRS